MEDRRIAPHHPIFPSAISSPPSSTSSSDPPSRPLQDGQEKEDTHLGDGRGIDAAMDEGERDVEGRAGCQGITSRRDPAPDLPFLTICP